MIAPAPTIEIPHGAPLEHPEDRHVTLSTGQQIPLPRTRLDGIRWRKALLESAIDNPKRQATLRAICADPSAGGCIFFLNAFAWTFKQREVGTDGVERPVPGDGAAVPMITWPCQDEAIIELERAMTGGHDVVVDKSRQLGATVLISYTYLRRLLFIAGSHFNVHSQIEDQVDRPGDPLAIFWKLDYCVQRLPTWLIPTLERTRMSYVNPTLGCSIMGGSSGKGKGRGGALTAALMDEAALMERFADMWVGYSQSTSCRMANSTPYGPGEFADMVAEPPGRCIKLVLPWYNHPEKGRGRRITTDEQTGEQYVTSPFYEAECARHGGRHTKTVRQELDRKHEAAGATFFDAVTITRLKARAVEPKAVGAITYDGPLLPDDAATRLSHHQERRYALPDVRFERMDNGPWRLWLDLVGDGRGNVRPPQDLVYTFGVDIGHGGGASNSTISVFCPTWGRKVAEFADAQTDAHALARIVAVAGAWFGGKTTHPVTCPETNGPGQTLVRELFRLGYPALMRREQGGPVGDKPTEKVGWHSSNDTKRVLLQVYREALNAGDYLNPSREALTEAERYIQYALAGGGTGIGPASLHHESAEARATHGDRVIADALSWHAATRTGPQTDEPEVRRDPDEELEEGLAPRRGSLNPSMPWRRW